MKIIVRKAENKEELKTAITFASKFDRKVLIEQGIMRKRDRDSSTWK